jgi:putative alpha-1,2-mannosidase
MSPKNRFLLSAIALLQLTSFSAMAQYHQFVDPMIGSEGLGNVFIGPSRPYGMVKPGPDCELNANSGHSPNMGITVFGFSQVHVSGTGGGPKYGNVSIMPFSGNFESIDQQSLRENETAELGYYSVMLKKWGIKTEITASHKVSFYQFTFAPEAKKALKIDLGKYLGETPVPDGREAQQFVSSEIEIVSDTEVKGHTRIRGGWNNGSAYTVYFRPCSRNRFRSLPHGKSTSSIRVKRYKSTRAIKPVPC